MLRANRLTLRYGDAVALDDVDLAIPTGEVVSVLGPSGSGKSSLLRTIAGLEPRATGTVAWDGDDLTAVPPHRRRFGLMFQDHALFPHRDVLGNVAFGLRMQRIVRADAEARARAVLSSVGLSGFEHRRPRVLSGGEQQRVALARALAPEPRLLMLDEPLGSLDRELRDRLVLELRALFVELGLTALFVTHDHEEAFAVADRVLILRAGCVEQLDTPAEVWRHPASEFAARFLGFVNAVPVDGQTCLARPDGLRIAADGPITGVVTARTFRRDHFLVTVVTESGAAYDVAIDGPDTPDVGRRVRIAVDPGAVVRFDQTARD